MTNSTRDRINAAFDQELAHAPVPPSLRAVSVHAAAAARRHQSRRPQMLAAVAAILAIALVATLVLSHGLRPRSVPAYSPVPPTGRAGASVAYDQAHGAMVLFGGNATTVSNETWTWDGKGWVHQHPSASPTPRHDAVMAYDPARHDIVLFGGLAQVAASGKAGQVQVGDTWIWNGTTWLELHPQHSPAIGFDWQAAMEFDPITQTVLLFGTRSTTEATTDMKAQTWSWNGSDWSQLSTSSGPLVPATMVSDGKRILMLASGFYLGGRYVTQTWAWDGATWGVLSPKVNLTQLGLASGAYDPERGQLVVLNGDTWTWDGGSWSRQHPALQPQSVGYMVYMASQHEVISWGDRSNRDFSDMYAWNGVNWKLIVPPGASVIPKVVTTNGKGGYLIPMSPDQAASLVRATVTSTRPVLLPAVLPGGPYDARVSATADDFNIEYRSDLRDKTISFGIVVPNPPPGGPNAQTMSVKFRNAVALKFGPAGYAEYRVYDSTAPLSARYLMWMEPGTTTNPQLAGPGVPYFLATTGLTEAEFWQVANSLQ